jgi:hypothetical protein
MEMRKNVLFLLENRKMGEKNHGKKLYATCPYTLFIFG